jgi:hypothetical protein
MSWSVCYESIYLKTRGDVFKLLLLCAGRREKAEKARMLGAPSLTGRYFPHHLRFRGVLTRLAWF